MMTSKPLLTKCSARWARIVLRGFKMIDEKEIFSVRELARVTGESRKVCRLAWSRREQIAKQGGILRKPGSGRPVTKAFSTKARKRKSIEILEDLKLGEHRPHGAKKLKCSVSTVYRQTHFDIKWRKSPDVDFRGDSKRVRGVRYEFALRCLTPGGKLKMFLYNATFIDHKQVHAFGQNRSHQLQARTRGSKKPLRPRPKANFNPKIHVLFSCNRFENNLFIHANIVPYMRQKGEHLAHESVNNKTLAHAIESTIAPAMKRVGSKLAVLDCVQLNHHKDVIAAFKKIDIEVFPSGGHPHNVLGGYPPYSHDCSPLDAWLFRPYQSEIAMHCKVKSGSQSASERPMMLELYSQIPKLWKSRKYERLAREAIEKQVRTLKTIVENKGAQKEH